MIRSFLSLLLCVGLTFGLGGCVTTSLPMAAASPWTSQKLDIESNPLDVAFTDNSHGFLVGSNRLVMETSNGGETWEAVSYTHLTLPTIRLV